MARGGEVATYAVGHYQTLINVHMEGSSMAYCKAIQVHKRVRAKYVPYKSMRSYDSYRIVY